MAGKTKKHRMYSECPKFLSDGPRKIQKSCVNCARTKIFIISLIFKLLNLFKNDFIVGMVVI